MKIVLNKCFGGFGLSHKAKMEIMKRKNTTVFPYVHDLEKEEVWTRFDGQKVGLMDFIGYCEKDPGTDQVELSWGEMDAQYVFADVDFDSDSKRGDKDLVEVVAELGEEANGPFADLRIVEIPDGCEWEISEYDGVETAHYGFQTGSV